MKTPSDKIIFIDIETVPLSPTLNEMPERLRGIWIELELKKRAKDEKREELPDYGFEDAAFRAEFSKIVCISVGRYDGAVTDEAFKTTSFASDNECEDLTNLSKVLIKYPSHILCAHNGKGFDYPFLARRYLINGLPLPKPLEIAGKKPWEIPLLDTKELWGFGARGPNDSPSLALLCAVFDVPTPKDDISGADVKRVYYEEKNLPRIARYCEKDVQALAAVYKKLAQR